MELKNKNGLAGMFPDLFYMGAYLDDQITLQDYPGAVTLGDGWTQDDTHTFSYASGVEATPSLDIGGIVAGKSYRIRGTLSAMVESLATANIRVRVGETLTDALVLGLADIGVPFDITYVAGADNALVRFIVDDNTNVASATLTNVTVQDVTIT